MIIRIDMRPEVVNKYLGGGMAIISVDTLCVAIKDNFKSVDKIYSSFIDPDDFYSETAYVPYVEKDKVIKNVWVQSEKKIKNIKESEINDNELYIIDSKCYLGHNEITNDEYNSKTHDM